MKFTIPRGEDKEPMTLTTVAQINEWKEDKFASLDSQFNVAMANLDNLSEVSDAKPSASLSLKSAAPSKSKSSKSKRSSLGLSTSRNPNQWGVKQLADVQHAQAVNSVGLELATAAPKSKKASKRKGVPNAKATTGKRTKGGQRKDPPPEPLSPETQGKATSALQAAIQSAVDADGTVDPVVFQTALDAGYSKHFVLDKVAAHLETLEDTKLPACF